MSWVLLLIELLPSLIKLIQMIWEWTAKLPREERPKARRELTEVARRHVQRHREQERAGVDKTHVLAAEKSTVQAELESLLESIKARVPA